MLNDIAIEAARRATTIASHSKVRLNTWTWKSTMIPNIAYVHPSITLQYFSSTSLALVRYRWFTCTAHDQKIWQFPRTTTILQIE